MIDATLRAVISDAVWLQAYQQEPTVRALQALHLVGGRSLSAQALTIGVTIPYEPGRAWGMTSFSRHQAIALAGRFHNRDAHSDITVDDAIATLLQPYARTS